MQLRHPVTGCLLNIATTIRSSSLGGRSGAEAAISAEVCNTLQHAATRCNTTHCNTLPPFALAASEAAAARKMPSAMGVCVAAWTGRLGPLELG